MIVVNDDLTELTVGVWDAFLGMACEEVPPGDAFPGVSWTSSVSISGGWHGSVALVIPERLANVVAAAMFAMEPDEVSGDEVADAIGELANVIGGNIKGMIDEPCQLSLPVVTTGENYRVRVPGTDLVSQVTFCSEGQPFTVSVSRQKDPA